MLAPVCGPSNHFSAKDKVMQLLQFHCKTEEWSAVITCIQYFQPEAHNTHVCLLYYGLAVASPLCKDGPISRWRLQSMY